VTTKMQYYFCFFASEKMFQKFK